VRNILIMLAFVSILITSSQSYGMDETDKCASSVDHVAMRKCLDDAATLANNELLKAEGKMMVALQGWDEDQHWRDKAIEDFKRASHAFREYQKQQCDFEASTAAGGNAAGDLRLECILRLSKERTTLLLKQANNLKD